MGFTHEIPSEFENEERWLKYLTLKSLICCLAAFGIGVLLSKLSSFLFSTSVPGIILGVILVLAAYVITMLKLPDEDYMKGGGLVIEKYLINRFCHKRSSCIYMLGYGNDEEEAA